VRGLRVSAWPLTVGVVAAAGIALRVWLYRSSLEIPDADEGLMGLLTRHILHGQIPTFLWGVAYCGPQEALLAVPGFAVFGSSWLALRIVPMALTAVTAVLVWRVGRRTIGDTAAVAAACCAWVWPAHVLFETTREVGFYAINATYCALIVLLALRVVERPDRTRTAIFGLVLGLAFWETSQIIPIAVPVVVWTVWRQPRALRHLWLALPLALLGALPWIAWNATHHWASLSLPQGHSNTTYFHRLRVFVSPLLLLLLGLRAPGTLQPLFARPLVYLVYACLLALFAYGAYRTRKRTVSILYVTAAVFPFVYSTASETAYSIDPRYLIVLSPIVVLLVAQLFTTWPRALVGIAVLGAITIVTFGRMQPNSPAVPRNFRPLIATLDRFQLDHVYTDYWVAYVLDFDTRERIVAVENKFYAARFENGQAVLASDPFVHHATYQREVQAAPRRGFVFLRDELPSIAILPQLVRHGYRRVDVGTFVVYVPPAS
jgi:4-amino-4-deoxy-L-arabinose transferase-like glycosyltransferase